MLLTKLNSLPSFSACCSIPLPTYLARSSIWKSFRLRFNQTNNHNLWLPVQLRGRTTDVLGMTDQVCSGTSYLCT